MKNTVNFANMQKTASQLASLTETQKNQFLQNIAKTLIKQKSTILQSNKKDVLAVEKNGLEKSFIHRLTLDEKGIDAIVERLHAMQELKSDIGSVIEERELKNKIILKKVRVPLGVIMIIYEARPEVTIDVVSLCIKSGNCVILKGGSEAFRTNSALYECILSALSQSGIPPYAVTFIQTADRKELYKLLKRSDVIDLVVARGGYAMVADVVEKSSIPVLAHAAGGARIYVDKSADLKMAADVIINAKITKPAACNAVDTVLIHKNIASIFIQTLAAKLQRKGVAVLGDNKACLYANIEKAKESNWQKEFLDLVIGLKVVNDVYEAIGFIQQHGKKHSEGIIANNQKVIDIFTQTLDAAALFINCSTRFHDGFEFGLGAEMGIATGKLHARGPVGLRELTTHKWIAYGNGQLRS